jgi:hypothetical protein
MATLADPEGDPRHRRLEDGEILPVADEPVGQAVYRCIESA